MALIARRRPGRPTALAPAVPAAVNSISAENGSAGSVIVASMFPVTGNGTLATVTLGVEIASLATRANTSADASATLCVQRFKRVGLSTMMFFSLRDGRGQRFECYARLARF